MSQEKTQKNFRNGTFFIILLAFIAVANSADQYNFENIRKCSKMEDRLICSQKGFDTKGFVYFPSKHKLYVFGNGSMAATYSIYKTSGFVVSEDMRGEEVYTFQDTDDIETFYCYKDRTIHRFLDKYGFEKKENLSGRGREFCEDKFNKLLP